MTGSVPRLPAWFYAASAILFGGLFAAFFAVREREAAWADGAVVAATEDVAAAAARAVGLSGLAEGDADYRLNGTPVRSRRLWIDGRGEAVLERIASDARDAGYRTERASIVAHPATIALHPQSGVLLVATLEEERDGRSLVRLAERRLRDAEDARALVPPDIALLADASDLVVVTPIAAADALTMSYAVARSRAWTISALEGRMSALGWKSIVGARGVAPTDESPLWLAKGDREASIVVRSANERSALVVIAVQNGKGSRGR